MHPFETLKVPQNSIGVHWFGQNSFGIKDSSGTIIMVDPYFPRVRPPEDFIHVQPPVDEKDIKTDIVLLTHDHGDHTCPETLGRIHMAFPNAHFYGPRQSIARLLEMGILGEQLTTLPEIRSGLVNTSSMRCLQNLLKGSLRMAFPRLMLSILALYLKLGLCGFISAGTWCILIISTPH
jgi:hypothetical protein